VTVEELNALPHAKAVEVFTACCGAHRWVAGMVERRPFSAADEVVAVGNELWRQMKERDWREAFDHHPRIGESRSAVAQDKQAASWSVGEQSRAATVDAGIQRQIADANVAYEARFGHIYIVCAAGRSADELLAIARSRMSNDPATEMRVAAEEQRKITELRLRKLLAEA
jgi:OHCU decarboxylase